MFECRFISLLIAFSTFCSANTFNPFYGVFTSDFIITAPALRPRFIQHAEQGQNSKIVIYGTSLSAGGVWSSTITNQVNRRYTGQITRELRGIASSDSNQGLFNPNDPASMNGLHEDRISVILADQADAYFVEFAVNDAIAARNTTLLKSRQNHEEIFRRISLVTSVNNRVPEIILPRLSRPTSTNTVNSRAPQGGDPYFVAYPEFEREYGHKYCDATLPAMRLFSRSPSLYAELYPDGLHMNARGYAFVADTLLMAWGEKALDTDFANYRRDNLGIAYPENPPSLNEWKSLLFTVTELTETSVSGANADPDLDGYCNLVEYAIGTDPKSSASRPRFKVDMVNGFVRFVYPRMRMHTANHPLTITVESSNNLVDWSSNVLPMPTISQTAFSTEFEKVETQSTQTINNQEKMFLRLKIEQTPE